MSTVHDASEILRLPRGRTLGYARFGDATGYPVFLMHGFLGSRLMRYPDDSIAASLSLHLIGLDRPGVGLSSWQRGRTLLSGADDVVALADALGIERFSVLGYSAGAAYACAVAYRYPERVQRLALVCGLAPFDRPAGWEGVAPQVARPMRLLQRPVPLIVPHLAGLYPIRRTRSRLETTLQSFYERGPEIDRQIIGVPAVWQMSLENLEQAVRGGGRGLARDLQLVARPWGFDPAGVLQPASLWYAEHDGAAPTQMGRYFASTLPNSRLTVVPGATHQMLFVPEVWQRVLEDLGAGAAAR